MVLVQEVARLGRAVHGEALDVDLHDAAVDELADADALLGVGDVLVADVADVDVTWGTESRVGVMVTFGLCELPEIPLSRRSLTPVA
mgnify:CR=1 FL=1